MNVEERDQVYRLLRYVDWQARGLKLKDSIASSDMVRVFLSAGKLRAIGRMVVTLERMSNHDRTK